MMKPKGIRTKAKWLLCLIFVLQTVSVSYGGVTLAAAASEQQGEGLGMDSDRNQQPYVEGEIIVKYKPHLRSSQQSGLRQSFQMTQKQRLPLSGAELVKLQPGEDVGETIEELEASGLIEYAQPNYLYFSGAVPPDAEQTWGLKNTGQLIHTDSKMTGTPGIDIGAVDAWQFVGGNDFREVAVAVIDTGTDINHPDLLGKIWINSNEIPGNGIDDDGNGYVDDVHGWDFYYNDNTVFDSAMQDAHGTHVSGTIAALVNNAGAAGAAVNAKIMPLKFIGPTGGTTLGAIKAIEYAAREGVLIANNSWSGGEESVDLALKDTIESANMLFVFAAGNGNVYGEGINTDTTSISPNNISAWNKITVAAVDANGGLASFSNYGASTVDIGAPGVDIYSTVPVALGQGYMYLSGTSMAAPHVSAVAAMIMGQKDIGIQETIQLMRDSGTSLQSLQGKTSTGNMVNMYKALGTTAASPTVAVSNAEEFQTSSLQVSFRTGSYGGLTAGEDTIALSIGGADLGLASPSSVSVNGVPVTTFGASSVHSEISLTVPVSIGPSEPIVVTMAGLRNRVAGQYQLSVRTSNDPAASYATYNIAQNTNEKLIRYSDIVWSQSSHYRGTVEGVMQASLQNGSFTGELNEVYDGGKVAVSHLPAGWSSEVRKQTATTVSISVYGDTGAASAGNEFSVSFKDQAFDGGAASSVWDATGKTFSGWVPSNPALTYSNILFVESDQNDGSISTTSTVTLTDTAFAGTIGTALNHTQIRFANIPAGLTAEASLKDSHTVVISLVGRGNAHTSLQSYTGLTVEFLDGAFHGLGASNVTGAANSAFQVKFKDGPGSPGSLAISQNNADVVLEWQASPDADYYRVLRSRDGSKFQAIAMAGDTGAAAYHYVDTQTGITRSKVYYKIAAYKGTVTDENSTVTIDLAADQTYFYGTLNLNGAAANGTSILLRSVTNGLSYSAVYNPSATNVNSPHGIILATDEQGAPIGGKLEYFFTVPNGTYSLKATSGNWETEKRIATSTSEMIADEEYLFYLTGNDITLAQKAPVIAGGGGSIGGGGFIPPVQQPPAAGKPEADENGAHLYFSHDEPVTVTAEQLKRAIEAKDPSIHELVIGVNTDGGSSVRLPLQELTSSSGIDSVAIRSNNASYRVPLSILNTAELERRLGASGDPISLTVRIEPVSGDSRQAVDRAASAYRAQIVGVPVEFKLLAESGGQTIELNGFGRTYVERTLAVDGLVNPSTTTAALVDPRQGTLSFVPATFTQQGGKTVATIKRNGNSAYVLLQSKRTFSDTAGHWAQADIELLASKLVLNGTGADKFSPGTNVTRAEFAAMMTRSLGLTGNEAKASYKDVAGGAWYAGAIGAAAAAGLVTGYEDGTFRPNELVTREQMAVMFARALDYVGKKPAMTESQLNVFADRSAISEWAAEAVAVALKANIVGGNPDGTFAPASPATRAQAAAMLKRTLQYIDFIN